MDRQAVRKRAGTLHIGCLRASLLPGIWNFSLSYLLNNNSLFHNKPTKKSYIMADISGPPMSYSSMKGRLHDGLLKGLEVMGYE